MAERVVIIVAVYISHKLIRYEASRGHERDGAIPNRPGNKFREKKTEKADRRERTRK